MSVLGRNSIDYPVIAMDWMKCLECGHLQRKVHHSLGLVVNIYEFERLGLDMVYLLLHIHITAMFPYCLESGAQ